MIPGPNSKVGWKMWKHLEPWQGARLDFEPMQCVYVCVSREEDREGHLKCTVGVTLKQSQPFAEPPRTARNPALAPRTSPEPAPQLLGIAQNETRPSPNFLEPGRPTGTSRTSRNPHRKLHRTLLGKNSMNTQAVGGVWVNVTTITTTICFLLGREAN